MIKGLAHTCFIVKDLDASIDFYQNKLGLQQAFDFINEKGEVYGIYFHVGQRTFIELFKGEPEDSPASSYKHMCLEVDDVKTTAEELKVKGLEVTEPKLGSDNSWQVWIEDPDGNKIELHAYTDESKQLVGINK